MRYAAICDDSKGWLESATTILETYMKEREMEMQLFCYNDIEKCIAELPTGTGVLFMDIEWEQEKASNEVSGESLAAGSPNTAPQGIAAAAEINKRYPDCHIVYLTNHLGYALDVYQTEHTWYVLKEQFADRLPEVFEKIQALEEERKQYVVVRTDTGNTLSIPCNSIYFIERVGRKTKIATDDGEVTIREKISEIEDRLPSASFGRCHNSIIVSFTKIRAIYKNSLMLTNEVELSISRGCNRDFRANYMIWAKDRLL